MNSTAEKELQLELERSQLHLFGLNADVNKCYYEHSRGRLERIATGVYLDAKLSPVDRAALLTKNAARIAMHMNPTGMLAGSSAFHRGAVEGHVMIATPRGGKAVDLGGVLTIYTAKSDLDLGLNREVEFVTIQDSFGEYSVKRVSDEMLVLKNFLATKNRPRSTYLNNADLNKVVDRCIRTLGTRDAFKRRLESLANAHGMAHYLKAVNAFIDNASSYTQTEKALEAFRVYWHRTPVATLSHDGHIWNFEYDSNMQIQLSMHEKKGKGSPPSFLGSLLPETGVKAGRTMEENLSDFGRGHRYISNITVQAVGGGADREIIVDMLDGELSTFRDPHLEFKGKPAEDLLDVMGDEELLSSLHRDPESPRMSGMQIKLAAHLSREGVLSAANGKAFTHIIKVVGSNQKYASMCAMEWFSLTIAAGCGLNTEQFAIADLGGYGPSLVVERFDVRRDLNDKRMILTEDFWSIQGMVDNRQKYAGELMDVADTIVKKSTEPEVDGRHLLAQAIFSWLTWNGDMHLKNLLLVKETKDPRRGFDSVKLSPMYDVLCTQVYPDDAKSAAIGLAGARNHTLAGFRQLGRKLGIDRDEVDAMVDQMTVAIPMWARKVAAMLPPAISDHEQSVVHIEKARQLFDVRCLMMIQELEAAKKAVRTRRGPAPDLESFSADEPEVRASAAEHIDAELRRSWIPAESKPEGQRRRPRP